MYLTFALADLINLLSKQRLSYTPCSSSHLSSWSLFSLGLIPRHSVPGRLTGEHAAVLAWRRLHAIIWSHPRCRRWRLAGGGHEGRKQRRGEMHGLKQHTAKTNLHTGEGELNPENPNVKVTYFRQAQSKSNIFFS